MLQFLLLYEIHYKINPLPNCRLDQISKTIELITTISDNNKCFLQSSESVHWEMQGATFIHTFKMRPRSFAERFFVTYRIGSIKAPVLITTPPPQNHAKINFLCVFYVVILGQKSILKKRYPGALMEPIWYISENVA